MKDQFNSAGVLITTSSLYNTSKIITFSFTCPQTTPPLSPAGGRATCHNTQRNTRHYQERQATTAPLPPGNCQVKFLGIVMQKATHRYNTRVKKLILLIDEKK